MILAGDIGGTKTALALYKADAGQNTGLGRPVREQTFASGDFPSLEAILRAFLRTEADRPRRATFAVAGPVIGARVKTTNLPWTICGDDLSQTFNIDSVHLINDLQAVAADVPHLAADEIHTLNAGEPHVHGAIAVVAPGTGLGEAFAVWTGSRYLSCPTEGGHASFGPNSHEELELLVFLERRFGHVSYERVCSGSGIQNLYDFLCDTGRYAEPDWLGRALKQVTDRTPVIVNAALEDRAEICTATLTLFVRILGGAVGNFICRVRYGEVVDFVLLHYEEWQWPAFNVADSAITVGAGLLIWDGLWGDGARRATP